MLKAAEEIQRLEPAFVSITYGAGGSTRDTSLKYARILQEEHGFRVMPHLTCVGHAKSELCEIIDQFYETGFRNIMALRGDPPKGETNFKPHPDGLAYANELVSLIKERHEDISIGVAGYPETHPEAPDADAEGAQAIRQIIRPEVTRLVDDIRRAYLYAAAETHGNVLGQVYLMGSVARWPGAAELITEMADVPARIMPGPETLFPNGESDRIDDAGPDLAVATGLALRGLLNHD